MRTPYFFVIVLLARLAVLHAAEPAPAAGFRVIFNGKDLAGWHGLNPHSVVKLQGEKREASLRQMREDFPKHWRVENGELINVGTGPYATTDEEFGDIELLIEYKTVPKADSGIYLRGTPQVQIWDSTQPDRPGKPDRNPKLGSGGLYNNTPKAPGRNPLVLADKPFGEWNAFRIRQIGARTWVWLNDKLVVDGTVMENFWDRSQPLPAKGPIMLQTHGGEIRWRNLFVREIGADETERVLREAGPLKGANAEPVQLDRGLVAHWPLEQDGQDVSGQRRHAEGRNVKFVAAPGRGAANRAAEFSGRNGGLEVPAAGVPRWGRGDFSVALWIESQRGIDDLPGDLLSCYDPRQRRGFQLSLKSNAGVTFSQANHRQLQFGIDQDRTSAWMDCGRPGKATLAFAMVVHEGVLYAGTCEPGPGKSGRVYRYAGPNQWDDCGASDRANAVTAMAVHAGRLYAGTGKYRLAGSALAESENTNLGGTVYRYEGGQRWTECGRLPGAEAVGGLVEYRGRLYASSLYKPAGFFRYEQDRKWTDCGVPDGKRVEALGVYDGYLYATSYDGGRVYRFDGERWTDCGQLGESTQTYAFAVYEGRLFVGTWPGGRVFRFEDVNRWTDVGRLGGELEVMGMMVHNGRLLAGTLPLAEVYAYGGDSQWTRLTQLDTTPDVKFRRAWTMAEHKGRLFCSTLPSGHVHAFEAGRTAAWENEFPEGWHHVAAIKQGGQLSLHVDGRLVARSATFAADDFDLTSGASLLIGRGMNDAFCGRMSGVRLYDRALNPAEIAELAKSSK